MLHCDGNEWYGGFDAVLYGGSTLDLFVEGCEQEQVCGENSAVETKRYAKKNGDSLQVQLLPREKYGNLRLHSRTQAGASKDSDGLEKLADRTPSDTALQTLPVAGDNNKHKEEETPDEIADLGNDAKRDASPESEMPSTRQPTVNPLENGFCFDITPSLLYASGDAVDNLVKSGVSDYLEFKSLKGLYLLMEEEDSSMARRGRRSRQSGKNKSTSAKNRDGDEDGASDHGRKLASYRVPCSKGDVFRSKLLSPIDKRRLMKLLQLISDYGMASQVGDGQSSSKVPDGAPEEPTAAEEDSASVADPETEPGAVSGEDAIQSINERHLHRGRALSRPQNKATPSSSEMDVLLRCIRDNVSFTDFLTKITKLPERLSAVVVYALALAPFGHLECKGTEEVSDVMDQISQYSTKDGLDDLVRHLTALGRFGDTAFLVPMYGSGELSQAFCRSGAVYGSTYMLRRLPLEISLDGDAHVQGVVLSGEEHIGGSNDLDTDDVSDTFFSCKHAIIPRSMMCPTKVSNTSQPRTYRRISILQGKLMTDQDQIESTDGPDTEQRHAIIIPPGTRGLKNKSAIHGLAVDDSAFVAPAGKNYTVLHLTTSGEENDNTPDEVYADALSKAVEYLIASQSTKDDASLKECHHISFSYSNNTASLEKEDGTNSDETGGLHICRRESQSLTCDAAFREAKRIFEDICPNSEFLALAKKVEDAIVYRDEHDSDDEKMVLESACTMIQPPIAENAPPEDSAKVTHSDDL